MTGASRVHIRPPKNIDTPIGYFTGHADPYEKADITSNTYYDWLISQPYIIFGANAIAQQFLDTFKDFPPRQRAASFSIDQAVEAMKKGLGELN